MTFSSKTKRMVMLLRKSLIEQYKRQLKINERKKKPYKLPEIQ